MRTIGIEIFYWMDRWADDQVPWFQRARDCGFDGVEISLYAGPGLDWQRVRAELDRLGLGVLASTGLGPQTDVTSPDASVRAAGVEFLKRCLETAARVGSPLLGGVTYAPWLFFPQAGDLAPYRERSAESLRAVAATAADLGVTLCLEIINRFETFMFNTVGEGLAFLDMIGSPGVSLQLDTYHMSMEEDDIPAAIRLAGNRLGHFHCANSNRRLPGPGSIDWAAVGSALDAAGYQGWLVIETFPNPAVETGRAVNVWRPLVQDFDAEARASLAYLRARAT